VDRSKDTLYFTSDATLEYLDGSLPGDFGFDPLGLMDPVNSGGFVTPEWLRYGEIINGRWAMLGAAGCIAPEVLGKMGMIPAETAIPWFRTGVIPPAGTYDGYWTDPYSLFFIEILALQFAELKRLQDYRFPGSQGKQYFLGLEKAFEGSGDPAYPGEGGQACRPGTQKQCIASVVKPGCRDAFKPGQPAGAENTRLQIWKAKAVYSWQSSAVSAWMPG
jgi:light-harvesting complex I chlorophyll a/b binding protein 3